MSAQQSARTGAAGLAAIATLLLLHPWSGEPAAALSPDAVQCPEARNPHCVEIRELLADEVVAAAFASLEANDQDALRDLVTLTEIPAPPFGEGPRAEAFAEMLRAAGADSVWIDAVGNVLAVRRGTGTGAGPAARAEPPSGIPADAASHASGRRTVALAGHLDTVFPEGTDVTVRQRGDTLFAPGIGDDTRGLVVVLHVLRTLVETGIRTDGDLLFIGTVGEEGLGDLRGVKHLFGVERPRIDAFIAVDGGDDEAVTSAALGSRRYRVTFSGEGGHSWGAFGSANPAHALGRAIALFREDADLFTATGERTSYNVGRIGGGTSVNSIPATSWMEVDMRSVSPVRLARIDSILHHAVERALASENETRRTGAPIDVELELVGDRPSGELPPEVPLVARALAVTWHFGEEPELRRSSTDANIPISLGIPAVTIGRGGIGGNAHSPDEWWLPARAYRGAQRALLLLVAEAGLEARRARAPGEG